MVGSAPRAGNPDPSSVIVELERILASRQLRESHQLQAFLDFIVRETLAGNQDSLKEYLLGCKVFGRRPDYDPRHDAIVRVQATALRKRLQDYYQHEGIENPVQIELPRGGYVPVFRDSIPEPVLEDLSAVTEPEVTPSLSRSWRRIDPRLVLAFLAGCVVSLAIALAYTALHQQPKPFQLTRASKSDFPQLWSAFFAPGAQNLLAFGVPLFFSADRMFFRDVNVNAPGDESRGRIAEFGNKLQVMPTPTDDIYTGLGELQGTNLLANFLTTNGMPVHVVSARAIGASELKNHNLAIISSLRFQTLLGDLHLPTDFEFLPLKPEVIRNKHRLPGEKELYVFESGAGVSTSYALVNLWPGPTAGRRILYIGGVHTWATQAATEFLLRPDALRKLSREFEKDRTSKAHGISSLYFQMLLRVEGRGNTALTVEYVTHHYLSAPVSATP